MTPHKAIDFSSLDDAFADLEQHHRRIQGTTKRWGAWVYVSERAQFVLTDRRAHAEGSESYGFAIDAAECQTPQGRLHWIAQVARKNVSAQVLGDFVRMIDDVIGLRAT